MNVIDLEGNEYALQATSTNEGETNGNQSFSATILPTKVNKLFINDIDKLWTVVDHDDVEQKIIHLRKKGEGESLTVEVKGIPLFFDTLDNDRIYERYDEHMTAQLAFTRIFEDTGFTFVIGGTFAAVEWEGFGDGETKLETFKRALERYKCEFRIVGNIVYLEHQIGNDTNHQYRHKLNASNIVQEVDANELWTYAKGYGDYGDGEGGEDWQNAKLTREYTSPIASIVGIRHAPPIKNGNITTKAQMDSQLKTLVDESLKISITADIHDLTRQNYPIAQSQLGDRVFVIDERIGLDEEVRIVNKSITRNWRGDILDVTLTFGSEGLAKRHQSKLSTAIKDITSLLEGKIQLPYSVLDDAVKNATKALKDAQTQLVFSENGILAIDKNNPNLVTLFNSAGIGVSKDGGATFGQALTGQGLNVDYVYTGTMLADYIAGGILAALNGNTVFNLNDGHLTMENTNFTLGGGASIEFTSIGNRIQYRDTKDGVVRSAGFGVGKATSGYPFAYSGTTGDRDLDTLSPYYSGAMWQTTRAISDGASNSISGNRLAFRNVATGWDKGMVFDWFGNTPSISTYSPSNYDYELGTFRRLYGKQTFGIVNYFNERSGWLIETGYAGDGTDIVFRGAHGTEYNYQIGESTTSNRIRNIYLRNAPIVSSDERLKTDIEIVDLEFAKKFLELNPKRYKKKLTNADLLSGIKGGNPYEFGFIAQEVEGLFDNYDLRFESLVTTGDDGYKSMSYENIHALHHRLLQDFNKRLELLENEAG